MAGKLRAVFARRVRLAVALLSVVGCATSPAEGWIRRPTHDHLLQHYPPQAARNGTGGFARIRCDVQADGRLTACEVLEESPAGAGFGEATLRLAPYFRMSREIGGQSVEGSSVEIPMTWQAG